MYKIQPNHVYKQARYPLDEGGGIFDANTNNGIRDVNRSINRDNYSTFHGTLTWGHDNIMGTYINTGTNKYLETLTGSGLFNFALESFSVSIWMKCLGTGDNYPPLVGHRQSNSGVASKGWSIHLSAGSPYGMIYAEISDGTTAPVTYDTTFRPANDGLWHFALFVVDRIKNVMTMTVDNIFFHSTSIAGLGSIATDGTGNLKFGGGPPTGVSQFNGSLADCRIMPNRIVSRGEGSEMYKEKFRRGSARPKSWELVYHLAGGGGAAIQNSAVTIIG